MTAESAPAPSREAAREWRDEAQRRYVRSDITGAVEALERALQRDPDDAQLWFMIGNAHFRLGNFQAAANAYRRSTSLRPIHPDTWLGAGFAHFYLSKLDSAVAEWELAVLQSPSCAICRLALALGYVGRGDLYFAGLQVELAVEQQPQCRDPKQLAVDVRWKPEAIAALQRIHLPDPEHELADPVSD